MKALGFSSGYTIRLNDRRLLRGIFEEKLGLSNIVPVYRAIDKLDKIGIDGVRRELEKLGLAQGTIEKILDIISISGEPDDILDEISKKYSNNSNVSAAVAHLREMSSLIIESDKIKIDMSLVRGLDYYTGPILEIVLDKPRIGSVAGGGRYDNLIGLFIGESIPATGVSIGLERIIDAGLELGIYNLDRKTVTEVQVIVMKRDFFQYAWKVTDLLRRGGIRTRIDVGRANERKQRKKAQRLSIPVLAFIGGREVESGTVTLYGVKCGERFTVKLDDVARRARELLSNC